MSPRQYGFMIDHLTLIERDLADNTLKYEPIIGAQKQQTKI